MKKKIEENLNTKIIGRNIKYFEKLNSTQLVARELAENNEKDGTIVITDNQEKGIGTHARKWYSESGKNIMFTLIIYPKCDIKHLNTVTVDIAKCIVNTIEKLYNFKLEIKYPNDIMYKGKKLGGILTQIITSGEEIRYLLIGIGLNINQKEFKGEIKETATSLRIELEKIKENTQKKGKIELEKNTKLEGKEEKKLDRAKIIAEFCNLFEEYCIENKII